MFIETAKKYKSSQDLPIIGPPGGGSSPGFAHGGAEELLGGGGGGGPPPGMATGVLINGFGPDGAAQGGGTEDGAGADDGGRS